MSRCTIHQPDIGCKSHSTRILLRLYSCQCLSAVESWWSPGQIELVHTARDVKVYWPTVCVQCFQRWYWRLCESRCRRHIALDRQVSRSAGKVMCSWVFAFKICAWTYADISCHSSPRGYLGDGLEERGCWGVGTTRGDWREGGMCSNVSFYSLISLTTILVAFYTLVDIIPYGDR